MHYINILTPYCTVPRRDHPHASTNTTIHNTHTHIHIFARKSCAFNFSVPGFHTPKPTNNSIVMNPKLPGTDPRNNKKNPASYLTRTSKHGIQFNTTRQRGWVFIKFHSRVVSAMPRKKLLCLFPSVSVWFGNQNHPSRGGLPGGDFSEVFGSFNGSAPIRKIRIPSGRLKLPYTVFHCACVYVWVCTWVIFFFFGFVLL